MTLDSKKTALFPTKIEPTTSVFCFTSSLATSSQKNPQLPSIFKRVARHLDAVAKRSGLVSHLNLLDQGWPLLLQGFNCWWFRNPVNSPAELTVVYLPSFTGWMIHPSWLFGISSINSRTPTRTLPLFSRQRHQMVLQICTVWLLEWPLG